MNPQISSKSAFIRSCSQRMSLLVRLTLTALVILTAVGSTAVAQSDRQELKVVDHIWGFDGRVQPGQFNPLSILLDNQTNEDIEATVALQRIQGMLNYSGGQYQQDIFIASTKRLWIQFYPYVSNSYTIEWELTVNDGDKFQNVKLEEFTQPRPTIKLDSDKEIPLPQVVILDKPDAMMAMPKTVKHLPENIFPPYASATVGLHSVFLDHNPDWELPRQQAFMSWLETICLVLPFWVLGSAEKRANPANLFVGGAVLMLAGVLLRVRWLAIATACSTDSALGSGLGALGARRPSTVLAVMPRTRVSASSEGYGPASARSTMMRAASTGPMPGKPFTISP